VVFLPARLAPPRRFNKRTPAGSAEAAAIERFETARAQFIPAVQGCEGECIRERQQAGIEAAEAKGVYKGRNPSVPVVRVREMRAAGQGPTAIAKALGISRMSVHRALAGA
jgi:DNA invertase Pin-like site-specific DNA recombinase